MPSPARHAAGTRAPHKTGIAFMNEQAKRGGGFLSKVMRFVTSPTTDWSDLGDLATDNPDHGRPVLKTIIENKHKNDMVRKREFSVLRAIRRQGQHADQPVDSEFPMEGAGLGEPKSPGAPHSSGSGANPQLPGVAEFESTRGMDPAYWSAVPESRVVAGEPLDQARDVQHEPVLEQLDDESFSITEWLAVAKLPEVNPELEHIAVSFASGDAADAEQKLKDLIAPGGPGYRDAELWLTLFDLYRATGRFEQFFDLAGRFAQQFGRSAPQWGLSEHGDAASGQADAAAAAADGRDAGAHWMAPPALTSSALVAMEKSLRRQEQPWQMDWRRLKSIKSEALPGLLETLLQWADSPVRFRFSGEAELTAVLAAQAASGHKDVDQQWWLAYLAWLRILGRVDEFEMVALEYCVTYEVSPPSWAPARCVHTKLAGAQGVERQSQLEDQDPPQLAPASDFWLGRSVAHKVLGGELLETIDAVLETLQPGADAQWIEIDCRSLHRVDFGAAGALLNWSISQRGKGRRIVFRHVHRLIAVFFAVMGLDANARVLQRAD